MLLCACWLGLLLPPGGAAAMDAAEALDLARLAAPKLEGAGLPRLTPEVVSIPCMQRTRQVLAGPGIANTSVLLYQLYFFYLQATYRRHISDIFLRALLLPPAS